jgi:hypothetical protein
MRPVVRSKCSKVDCISSSPAMHEAKAVLDRLGLSPASSSHHFRKSLKRPFSSGADARLIRRSHSAARLNNSAWLLTTVPPYCQACIAWFMRSIYKIYVLVMLHYHYTFRS